MIEHGKERAQREVRRKRNGGRWVRNGISCPCPLQGHCSDFLWIFNRVKSERKVGWWKGCPDGCVEGMNVGEDAYMDG